MHQFKLKLLQKEGNWAKESPMMFSKYEISWAKRINELLHLWGLDENWDDIAKTSKGEWKKEVEEAAEKMNIKKLQEETKEKM